MSSTPDLNARLSARRATFSAGSSGRVPTNIVQHTFRMDFSSLAARQRKARNDEGEQALRSVSKLPLMRNLSFRRAKKTAEVLDVRVKEQGHNLDWLRRLGMHVWFEQRADDSLRDSFISYNKVQ